ncbi:PA216 protein, partial [Oenanthe oenanthe]|nr:PA216 protein [Oenanthe oenanthe]
LIEIERGDFDHWAIYVGRGYVIHVTGLGKAGVACVSSGFGQVVVKKKLLEKVVRKNKWCVNNKYDNYWKPFPVKEIIQRAEGWVGEKVPYCCFWNNCEHFVTKLRYGVGLSDQVSVT